MSAIRIAFRVHGVVQGVGFRDFTQKRAVGYGLKGFVRNTTDERVEGEAQGERNAIDNLIDDIGKGPRLANVTKMEKKEVALRDGETSFVCKPTAASEFTPNDS